MLLIIYGQEGSTKHAIANRLVDHVPSCKVYNELPNRRPLDLPNYSERLVVILTTQTKVPKWLDDEVYFWVAADYYDKNPFKRLGK